MAAMAILHHRLRRVVTGAMLFVMACFLASLFLSLFGYYLQAILLYSSRVAPARHVIGVALGIAIYLGILRLLWALESTSRAAAIGATAGVIGVQTGRTLVHLLSDGSLTEVIHIPAITLISLYLLFVGVVLFRAAGPEENGAVARLLRRFGILLVVFAPVSTLLYLLIDFIPPGARPYLSFDFVFFPIWGVIVLSVFIEYLARPSAFLEDGEVSTAFRTAFGITPRESEVVSLISQGLSNQDSRVSQGTVSFSQIHYGGESMNVQRKIHLLTVAVLALVALSSCAGTTPITTEEGQRPSEASRPSSR